MKTLLSLLSVLLLIVAAVSLDAYQLDAGILSAALTAALLFAFALNDNRRLRPPLVAGRIRQFPGPCRDTGRSSMHRMDLAA
ncbi:MAG: hypothetical protein WC485_03760 [Opitutaceae bacterium]